MKLKIVQTTCFMFILLIAFSVTTTAHSNPGNDVYVRVVSADPSRRTFTFSCSMDPEKNIIRDWFIRLDNGNFAVSDPEEATFLDKPAGQHLTYTFKENKFYHIGCLIVDTATNPATIYRGDLHIDLRTASWNPGIIAVSGNGLTATYQCQHSSTTPGNPSWEVIDAKTGVIYSIGGGAQITHTVAGHGLYDYICNVDGKSTGLPVEYFDSGNPYFPDSKGVPHGVKNLWIRETTQPTEPPSSNNSSDSGILSNSTFTSIKNIPSTCKGGTIVQDIYDGGRHVVCSSSSANLAIDAWEKPDQGSPQYFEIYKKSQSGQGIEICIADACIASNGYDKSSNYPISSTSSGSSSSSSSSSSGSGGGASSYSNVENIPATCEGGTITQDIFMGGRSIICMGSGKSLVIEAWDKPSIQGAQYFEMYKKSESGDGLKICIVGVCISDNGFSKSQNYPITFGTSSGTGSPGTGTLSMPKWISPSNGLTGVAPDFFHLELEQDANSASHVSTDYEIWKADGSQRVWSASGISGSLKYHAHTPDGIFEGSLAGQSKLASLTTYIVRTRYKDSSGAITPWSEWRTFTTKSATSSGTPSSSKWAAAPGFRVELFASGFDVPVHVAAAPPLYNSYPESQRPKLYVTELYGKIKVVYNDGSSSVYASNLLNFPPFSSITGGGQMGVVGLYVDDVTGDLFVGMTYVENNVVKNKIVRFFTSDDGRISTGTKILIGNLPSAPSHQVQQITKGPDGKLYINLGDAQMTSFPQDNTKLAGKIIRMNLDGTNLEVYAKGFRNPFGADWRPGTNQLFVTDNSPDYDDRLLKVVQGGNYGWCCDISQKIYTLGVSPVDVEFNPGNNGFPSDLTGKMYVAVAGQIYQQGPGTNGKHILEFTLDNTGNVAGVREFVKYVGGGYGTPIGLDFASDGLYFTDIYGENGFVGLGDTEASIYRVVPGVPNPGSEVIGNFRAGIEISPWFPQKKGSMIEYEFTCKGIDGSGNYVYDYNLGDGTMYFHDSWNKKLYQYPFIDKEYTVSCTVKDKTTGQSASAGMIINPSKFIAG